LKCVTFILYLLNKSYPFSQLYWLYEYPPWKCRVRPDGRIEEDEKRKGQGTFCLYYTNERPAYLYLGTE